MKLKEHDKRDDRKVWLSQNEVEQLLNQARGDTTRTLAYGLGVRCGLRAREIVDVSGDDIVRHDTGPRVRVQQGKGGKYREIPLPESLYAKADTVAEYQDGEKLIQTSSDQDGVTTRTIERWVNKDADTLAEETGDEGWRHLSPHDLRRTWGTLLVSTAEVEPGMVMEWGGWEDWDTFREHYLGAYSPEAEQEQIEKVSWL